jgi:hypothetical protein
VTPPIGSGVHIGVSPHEGRWQEILVRALSPVADHLPGFEGFEGDLIALCQPPWVDGIGGRRTPSPLRCCRT